MNSTTTSPWYYSSWQIVAMYLRFMARIVLMSCALCFSAQLGGYDSAKYLLKNKIFSLCKYFKSELNI